MSQCLHCNQPCSTTSIFCDECQPLLPHQTDEQADGQATIDVSMKETSPLAAVSETFDRLETEADEKKPLAYDPQTPVPPMLEDLHLSEQEQALFLLNDAARYIAEVEPGDRRAPRASRLAPVRDISAEIRRESTPSVHLKGGANTEPMIEVNGGTNAHPAVDGNKSLPDLWPWFPEPEEQEGAWIDDGNIDPLGARRVPTSADYMRMEAADVRRARKEGFVAGQPVVRSKPHSRMRIAFFCLAILAVLALTIDSVLISFTFTHTQQSTRPGTPGAPTLTLSSNVAHYGSRISLSLKNFKQDTRIALTHDVAVPLLRSRRSVKADQNGNASIDAVIDESWEPGFHTIVAEDAQTRYTANATLQVAEGRTRPSRLVLNNAEIDFGAEFEGGTTIQRFVLTNGGGGSITWSASSDVPWLSITPNQGVFSDAQTITIGCTRSGVKEGEHDGTITFSSNVGDPQRVKASMTVRRVPPNAGPVLAVAPAGLSFTAVDGGTEPAIQSLVITNPGSKPLSWTMSSNTALLGSGTGDSLSAPLISTSSSSSDGDLDTSANWVVTDRGSGVVRPRENMTVNVIVHSASLLPGSYINTLVFKGGDGTLGSPQSISVSLTVQPRCGLTVSTGSLSFTAVVNKSNPSAQSFTLLPNPSCSGPLKWQATSSANWLTVTPTVGQISSNSTALPPTVSVNIDGLKPDTYPALIFITAGQSTQTIAVTLALQAPPAPTAPIMGVSSLGLNMTTTQGASNPTGQQVSIANTGMSTLKWRTTINLLASAWLGVYPSGGMISAGQTGVLTVNAITKNLTPGKYVAQIVLTGTDTSDVDAGGSPQTIAVTLTVLPPCKISQPSSSSLVFNALLGGSNPAPQSMVLTASGNCLWPLHWSTSANSTWLGITPTTGTFTASGQAATLVIAPNIAGLAAGSYTSQGTMTVTDSAGAQVDVPQNFSVALTVQQPCVFQAGQTSLSFSITAGSAANQSVTLAESGSCAFPVSWNASTDSGSVSWLSLAAQSGTDSGTGSNLSVHVDTSSLTAGTYRGTITVNATGSGGTAIQGSPQTIPVTLTVNAVPTASVSGIVNACSNSACTTTTPLGGATVKLFNSNNVLVATATTSSSGTYTVTGVPLGSYTVTATGTDVNTNQYSSDTLSLTVNGDVTGFTIQVKPA